MILKFFTYKTIFLSIHLNIVTTRNKHASFANRLKSFFLDLRKRYECSSFSLSIKKNSDDQED